jgi:hypothetical protein
VIKELLYIAIELCRPAQIYSESPSVCVHNSETLCMKMINNIVTKCWLNIHFGRFNTDKSVLKNERSVKQQCTNLMTKSVCRITLYNVDVNIRLQILVIG